MVGEVRNDAGQILSKGNFNVVKKIALKGETIQKHNHPEADILFTVVKGLVRVVLNEDETHDLKPGDILYFDGSNYISVELLEDGEFFVTLINK